MPKKPQKKTTRAFDAAPAGYQRWTAFVRSDLLEQFKRIAKAENKTFLKALEEALENWTYDPDSDS
jgi:hypothetical protein